MFHSGSLKGFDSMAPKSVLWAYFQSNKTKYKADNSHLNAWCNACVSIYIHERSQSDLISSVSGLAGVNRTGDELKIEGE